MSVHNFMEYRQKRDADLIQKEREEPSADKIMTAIKYLEADKKTTEEDLSYLSRRLDAHKSRYLIKKGWIVWSDITNDERSCYSIRGGHMLELEEAYNVETGK